MPETKTAKACMHSPYQLLFGAGNETRTRDLYLGKVSLYQLSYSRVVKTASIIAVFGASSRLYPLIIH